MFYASVVIILNHEGNLLVVRRSASLVSYPGHWCFPGGRAEGDETPEQCAVREVSEEVSLVIEEEDLALLNIINKNDKEIFVFAVKKFSGTPRIDWESDSLMWIEPSKIGTLKFIPTPDYILDTASSLSL